MRATGVALFLSLFLAPALAAQMTRWERQVRDRLERVLTGGPPSPATGSFLTVGNLNGEEADTLPIALRTGETYEVLAVCDDDCGGLRLVVATDGGDELAAARVDENLPVLRFTPPRPLAYRLRIVMSACRMNPCWYAVGIRRAKPPTVP